MEIRLGQIQCLCIMYYLELLLLGRKTWASMNKVCRVGRLGLLPRLEAHIYQTP